MVPSRGMVFINGLTTHTTKDIGVKIFSTAWVNSNGTMEGNIMVTGREI